MLTDELLHGVVHNNWSNIVSKLIHPKGHVVGLLVGHVGLFHRFGSIERREVILKEVLHHPKVRWQILEQSWKKIVIKIIIEF